MQTLPDSLSRRGIATEFDKLTPVAWERLFDKENQNGIARLRVPGDMNNRAYYSGEGMKDWLLSEGHYHPEDFPVIPDSGGWTGAVVRRHALAA